MQGPNPVQSGVETLLTNTETEEMEGKYLTFSTDGQLFGIPISEVVQIVGVQEITEIPEFPSYAKGIINLRGNMIPIIDVRLRFGKKEVPYDQHTCMIVTSIQGAQVGFLVDGVDEVANIAEEDISAPPKLNSGDSGAVYLTGIASQGGKNILLLDAAKLLSDEVLAGFTQSI